MFLVNLCGTGNLQTFGFKSASTLVTHHSFSTVCPLTGRDSLERIRIWLSRLTNGGSGVFYVLSELYCQNLFCPLFDACLNDLHSGSRTHEALLNLVYFSATFSRTVTAHIPLSRCQVT